LYGGAICSLDSNTKKRRNEVQNHQNAPWTRVPVSIKTMPYSIIFPSKENNRRARKVILRSNYKHPVKFASKKTIDFWS